MEITSIFQYLAIILVVFYLSKSAKQNHNDSHHPKNSSLTLLPNENFPVIFIVSVIYCAITNEPLLFETYTYFFNPTETNRKVKKLFEELKPRYRPTWFLPGNSIKDIFLLYPLMNPINKFYKRVMFKFKSDGDQVALDFYPRKEVWSKHSADWTGKPFMIIIPGLSEASLKPAVSRTCHQFWQKYKIRTVVANRRGYGGVDITGDHPLSWVRWEDMDEIIDYLALEREDTKGSRFFMYGHSLGAAFVHLYNGVKGKSGALNMLEAAIAVSSPYDFGSSGKKIAKNLVIDQVLLKGCFLQLDESMKDPRFVTVMKQKGITKGN